MGDVQMANSFFFTVVACSPWGSMGLGTIITAY